MASVGGVTCDFVRGNSTKLKESLDIYALPGIDGAGAQKLGKSDASFEFTATKLGTANTVESWFRSIEDLQGSVISVTDDWDQVHDKMLVSSVSLGQRTPDQAPGSLGAIGTIRISGTVLI